MYDFGLKYAKLHKSGPFGHCGTGTTLFGTGTSLILLGGTGTDWLLLGGTGTASKFLPINVIFAHFWYHFSSYNFSNP